MEEAEAYDAQVARKHAGSSYSYSQPADPMLTWYRSFFALPLLAPLVMASVLGLVTRSVRGSQLLNWSWVVGAPLGFLGWLSVWMVAGGANGSLTPAVLLSLCGGWLAWSIGIHWAVTESRRIKGIVLVVLSMTVWSALVATLPSGTGILSLALLSSGSLIALYAIRFVVRRTSTLCQDAYREWMGRGIMWIE